MALQNIHQNLGIVKVFIVVGRKMARNGHNVVTVFLKQRLLASRISNRKNVNIDEEANLWNIWSCLIIVVFSFTSAFLLYQ